MTDQTIRIHADMTDLAHLADLAAIGRKPCCSTSERAALLIAEATVEHAPLLDDKATRGLTGLIPAALMAICAAVVIHELIAEALERRHAARVRRSLKPPRRRPASAAHRPAPSSATPPHGSGADGGHVEATR